MWGLVQLVSCLSSAGVEGENKRKPEKEEKLPGPPPSNAFLIIQHLSDLSGVSSKALGPILNITQPGF